MNHPPRQFFWYIPSTGSQYTTRKLVLTTILKNIEIIPVQYPVHFYADIGTHPCKNIFEKTVYDTALNLICCKLFAQISVLMGFFKAVIQSWTIFRTTINGQPPQPINPSPQINLRTEYRKGYRGKCCLLQILLQGDTRDSSWGRGL